ncbi:Fe-S cluster assembly protein SufB [Mollicutes bacterium LVI A0078]|nr:Fe-S cluster assembly protein SufB [Mollicutes bacterium LVI A0075]WOO90688.1 Fe-S cluster assembly protein SufB [Mollicutes bacterium LVI A0078]
MENDIKELIEDEYEYGFMDKDHKAVYETGRGLTRETVIEISNYKNEPEWMLDFRLKSYDTFLSKPMPEWGADLSIVNIDNTIFYSKPSEKVEKSWDDVPKDVKETFEKLGIPEAEAKYLSGVSTQYDSEVVYENMIAEVEEKGVVFMDTDRALREYPELFKKYFGKIVPASDNKFSALNSAVWSGGSFIYVPKGVKLDMPLQAYFRINTQDIGQFERTLIIVDEGADVHYVEGCTAPVHATDSLHAAVVEIFVHENANCRYSTIQNWSGNVLNLVTKRAKIDAGAHMEWIDGNIGSKITMKYPAIILAGEGARGTCVSVAIAGKGKHIDAGAKMIHLAPNTKSEIISKSIAHGGGNATYRGIIEHMPKATNSKSSVECDTIIIDEISKSDTIPFNIVKNDSSTIAHEATVSKINDEQLFYLMSRGLSEEEATQIIIMGFIDEFAKELPMEYAVELNRLINLEMEGSIG